VIQSEVENELSYRKIQQDTDHTLIVLLVAGSILWVYKMRCVIGHRLSTNFLANIALFTYYKIS